MIFSKFKYKIIPKAVIGFLVGVRHFSLLLLGSVPYSSFDNLSLKNAKFTLEHATKAQRGVDVYLYSFFNLGPRREWMVIATPRSLYLRERPCTHFIGGWVGPRAGLDECGKSRPPPGFDHRTIQPVA